MRRLAKAVAAITVLLVGTAVVPAEDLHVALVPWKVIEPGTNVDAPLVLFWIPASPDEVRRSPLLTSQELTLFSSRCVAMRVVRLNDRARLAKLDAADGVPLTILADQRGTILGRVTSEDGVLPVGAIEELVREELEQREADADARLDRAADMAEDDVEAAVALYRSVWEDRCTCPRQGRDAKKALRKLKSR